MKKNELVGQRFSRLVVTHDGGRNKRKNVLWACVCDCGGTALAAAYDLRAGKVKSCGCLVREGPHKTHGLSKTPIYNVWSALVQRCINPNDRAWKHYGGRGIKIDPAWLVFSGFYADMGSTYQHGLSIDRLENDGPYTAKNCVWRATKDQCRNKRSTVFVEIDGSRYPQVDAARVLGITPASIWAWRKKGMTDNQIVERARWLQQKRG